MRRRFVYPGLTVLALCATSLVACDCGSTTKPGVVSDPGPVGEPTDIARGDAPPPGQPSEAAPRPDTARPPHGPDAPRTDRGVTVDAAVSNPSTPAQTSQQQLDALDRLAANDTTDALAAEFEKQKNGSTYDELWRAAYAAFLICEHPSTEDRETWSERAYELAEKAKDTGPNRVEGWYAYAVSLGVWMREHKLRGAGSMDDLAAAGEKVVALDAKFARGGGHRLLGLFYVEAPTLLGPGDDEKGEEHVRRAIAIDPNFFDNQIAAAQAMSELGREDDARRHIERARQIANAQSDETIKRSYLKQVELVEKEIG